MTYENVKIHPAVDNGVKKGDPNFAGGTLQLQVRDRQGRGEDRRADRAQPCLRLHQVLEARGRGLRQVAVVGRDKVEVTKNAPQAQGRRRGGDDPAPCLHRLRRPHVRPHREQGASVLRARLRAHRAVAGERLVGAAVRGLRVVGDRVGRRSVADGGHPRPAEGARARALRLPVAAADGRDRDARRQEVGRARRRESAPRARPVPARPPPGGGPAGAVLLPFLVV